MRKLFTVGLDQILQRYRRRSTQQVETVGSGRAEGDALIGSDTNSLKIFRKAFVQPRRDLAMTVISVEDGVEIFVSGGRERVRSVAR